MVAPRAREDFEDLQAAGLKPTLEDFDRLNSLCLRLECGAETTGANFPRVGWAGDIPFYQPTVQAFVWYMQYAERLNADDETMDTFWFFALAHAREPGFFERLRTPEEIEAAVSAWAFSLPVTREEIARACRYAVVGFDDAKAGRNPNIAKRENRDIAAEALNKLQSKMDGVCAACGVPFEKLYIETPSRLDALYDAYCVEQGREMKRNETLLYADYKFALVEIRERLKKEAEATDGHE